MKFQNFSLNFSNNDFSASRNSESQDLSQDAGYSLQIVLSGAALTGSLKLQASNDNSTWTDIAGSSQAVSGITSANYLWNYDAQYYQHVRAVWTYTSGTGSVVSSKMTTKG